MGDGNEIVQISGVISMKESSTYQAILEEGAIAEAKKILRWQGEKAFGPPDGRTALALERLSDLPQLEELILRIWTVASVASWQELLDHPAPGRRRRKRHLP